MILCNNHKTPKVCQNVCACFKNNYDNANKLNLLESLSYVTQKPMHNCIKTSFCIVSLSGRTCLVTYSAASPSDSDSDERFLTSVFATERWHMPHKDSKANCLSKSCVDGSKLKRNYLTKFLFEEFCFPIISTLTVL